MRYLAALAVILCAILCVSSVSAGPTDDGIAFQGRLTDASDNPVPDGPRDLILSIWTDSVDGSMLHTEIQLVSLSNGLFSACIGCGSSSFFDIFTDQPLFLQTQLAGEPAMVPRTRLRNASRAMVSSRVLGDIITSPGRVAVGDVNGDGIAAMSSGPDTAGLTLSKTSGGRSRSGNIIVFDDKSGVELKTYQPGQPHYGNITFDSYSGLSQSHIGADSDGDGLEDFRVSSSAGSGGGDAGGSILIEADLDGDGLAENSVNSITSSSSAKHAINTKGAGGVSRSVSSTTNDTSADHVIEADFDGDGISEESIESSISVSSAKHAINTKGAGGVSRSIVSHTDDTSAAVSLDCDDASISLKVKNGGTVNGHININSGNRVTIGLGSDGNGYFDLGIGVGVDPTHAIDVAGGAYCDGTDWVNASDANSKEYFESVDGEELLAKISALDITRWNYKNDTETEHIGPTAQDFQEIFGVGSDGKSISTIDPSGIALAAIKELSRQNRELKHDNENLRKQLEMLALKVENLAAGR